jgi:hypothetical protein
MAESLSPLEDLKKFRELLVQERRYVIRNFLHMRQYNKEENKPTVDLNKRQGDEVLRLQKQIRAVDEAIKDEESRSDLTS